MDYAAKAAAADRMIRQYGASGVLTSVSAVYDPAAGSTTPTETTQDVQMVAYPYSQRFVDGTSIRASDLQAYISAVGISAPKVGDRLKWGETTYQVIGVRPLEPALVAVLYEAQLRAQ